MKNLIVLVALLLSGSAFSQKAPAAAEIKVVTSAECGTCKKILEDKLNYTKGVRFAELDVESKVLKVSYATKKTNPDEIRKVISEIGYDADEVNANPSSQQQLPKCCQPGGMKK